MSTKDDFFRRLWIHILKSKSEAFDRFKEWCNEVETKKGVSFKCLRTENGLDFLSAEFNDNCQGKGIKRYKIVLGNPQKMFIERMNMTILERFMCMIFNSGLPRRIWAEATNIACTI